MLEARPRFRVSLFTVDQFQNRVNELGVPIGFWQDLDSRRHSRVEAGGHQKRDVPADELLHQGGRVLLAKSQVEDRGIDSRAISQELTHIADRVGEEHSPGPGILQDPLSIKGDQKFVLNHQDGSPV
jgi:hypothetical protein